MHIISGLYKNRTLSAPSGTQTRPTSSSLREAVFNICRHQIEDADFLDLFAGSGAMGLEALSRGAKSATFIDNHKESIKCIEKNIRLLKVESQTDVWLGDAAKFLDRLEKLGKRYDIIYIDPPYDERVLIKGLEIPYSNYIIAWLDTHALLKPNGSVFVEEAKSTPHPVDGLLVLSLKSSRRMGRSMLHEYQSKKIGIQ